MHFFVILKVYKFCLHISLSKFILEGFFEITISLLLCFFVIIWYFKLKLSINFKDIMNNIVKILFFLNFIFITTYSMEEGHMLLQSSDFTDIIPEEEVVKKYIEYDLNTSAAVFVKETDESIGREPLDLIICDNGKKKKIKEFLDQENESLKKEVEILTGKIEKYEEEKILQREQSDKTIQLNLKYEQESSEHNTVMKELVQKNKKLKISLFFACASTATISMLVALFLKDKIPSFISYFN